MWILDFDLVRPIWMDEEGIEDACAAFRLNDRYCPRPFSDNPADRELWEIFAGRFVQSSKRILGEESTLPEMFIKMLEELEKFERERIRHKCEQDESNSM
jgi:hypothetical protein